MTSKSHPQKRHWLEISPSETLLPEEKKSPQKRHVKSSPQKDATDRQKLGQKCHWQTKTPLTSKLAPKCHWQTQTYPQKCHWLAKLTHKDATSKLTHDKTPSTGNFSPAKMPRQNPPIKTPLSVKSHPAPRPPPLPTPLPTSKHSLIKTPRQNPPTKTSRQNSPTKTSRQNSPTKTPRQNSTHPQKRHGKTRPWKRHYLGQKKKKNLTQKRHWL